VTMAGLGALLLFHPTASPPRSMPSEVTDRRGPAPPEHFAQQPARGPEAASLSAAMAQFVQEFQSISPSATPDPALAERAQEPVLPKPTPQMTAPAASPPSSQAYAEIAALVARGDSLLGVGDIASARLFYERAADAGDGPAALRLGATFDPGFLDRAGLHSIHADPGQAETWYRRARELGDAAAKPGKSHDQQQFADPNAPTR
jgi:TPR repeat protein